MNKKIIIIDGYLASGKSTFAVRLAKALRVPYFVKDTFKIALCANISVDPKEEGSRFSVVTFDAMMYAAERLMEAGLPFITEGNFVPAGVKKVDEAGTIKNLIEKYDYTPLTFKFTGDTRVLYARYIERDKTPERGRVNMIRGEFTYDDFYMYCHNLDAFDVGGEVIEIDTTDFSKADFEKYIETARAFINLAL